MITAGILLLAGLVTALVLRAFILAVIHQSQARQFATELREIEWRDVPAPGLDYISDPGVLLPWTPPAERLATDTDIRNIAPPQRCIVCAVCGDADHARGELAAWVIDALGKHDGPDAAVDSIVARATRAA